MPHRQGYSKKTISYNIKHMIKTGHSKRQAVAASYSTARKAAKRAGVRPKHLR
jgi:hypothetical protein